MSLQDILKGLKESGENVDKTLKITDTLTLDDSLKPKPEESIENNEEFQKALKGMEEDLAGFEDINMGIADEGGILSTLSEENILQNNNSNLYNKLDELTEEYLLYQPLCFIDEMLENGFVSTKESNTYFVATRVRDSHLAENINKENECIVIITKDTPSMIDTDKVKVLNTIETNDLLEIFVYDKETNDYKELDE